MLCYVYCKYKKKIALNLYKAYNILLIIIMLTICKIRNTYFNRKHFLSSLEKIKKYANILINFQNGNDKPVSNFRETLRSTNIKIYYLIRLSIIVIILCTYYVIIIIFKFNVLIIC